jgi:hypothetical protein
MIEFLLEVTVQVDEDELNTEEDHVKKERQIRRAIESIDPSIGIFQVENFQ